MDIMNLIHDICLTKNRINNTPRWKFITRNKEIKKLNNLKLQFLNLNIFDAADSTITFLISLDKNLVNRSDIFLFYGESHLLVKVIDDDVETLVTYFPKNNWVEVATEHTCYSIYRNSKISKRVNKMWEPLINKIKEKYLEIIIEMIKYLK